MSVDIVARALAAQGKSAVAATNAADPRLRIVSNLAGAVRFSGTKISNGTTQTSGTDQVTFTLNTDATALRFIMANGYINSASGQMLPTGNGVSFRMSFEVGASAAPQAVSFPTTLVGPISVGGKTGSYIGDGEMQMSTPFTLGGTLLKDTQYSLRIYKKVSSGELWPLNWNFSCYGYISGKTTDQQYGSTDTTGSDQTYQSSPTWGNSTGGPCMWAPSLIIGAQTKPLPVAMVTGDSISQGFGETTGRGYLIRGLVDAGNIGYYNAGVSSARTFEMVSNFSFAHMASNYVDYILIHIGTNDMAEGRWANLAAAQASYLSVAKAFTRPGVKLLFATILPRNTSTNGFIDYANQTVSPYESLRLQINNWLRDSTASGFKAQANATLSNSPVLAVFDPCTVVERNSDGSTIVKDGNGQQANGTGGYWLAGATANLYTADGTHPTATMSALMAASVPTSLITLP